jgi:hypothetical protein
MKQTAVEWLVEQICGDHTEQWQKEIEQAKEMEKKEKIEFAYQVAEASAEKYIQGKTTWQIAEELLNYKSE